MTTFSVEMFQDLVAEGAMSTKFEPIPEGEYEAVVEEVEAQVLETDDGPRPTLRLTWKIIGPDVEKLQEQLGRQQLTVSQTVFLDIDEVDGKAVLSTAKGKNVQLGRIREALGQNTGKKWSISMLQGAGPAIIQVKHSAAKDDPERIFANVRNVRSL